MVAGTSVTFPAPRWDQLPSSTPPPALPSSAGPPSAGPPSPGPMREPRREGWRRAGAIALCMLLTSAISVAATALVLRTPGAEEWVSVYREDFKTDSPVGDFPAGSYPSRFTVYPDGWSDTSGRGRYAPSRVLSVADGALRWDMHSENGMPLGAAVMPTLPTYGQTYGRYSVRFRADPEAGFGLAFLLWPDSEKWPRDGEIDFPEGELSGNIKAVAHHATERGTTDPFRLSATFDTWHVATIEWRPHEVTFLLDDEVVGTSTADVPSRSMHWVLQAGSDGVTLPDPTARAQIEVDWLEAQVLR